jgi:hypothetical protein
MNDGLDGRVVYSPRGRNAEDDLAECMVAATDIFLIGGQLIWINGGRYIPVVRQAAARKRSRIGWSSAAPWCRTN